MSQHRAVSLRQHGILAQSFISCGDVKTASSTGDRRTAERQRRQLTFGAGLLDSAVPVAGKINDRLNRADVFT